ncbi:uncharacterized protein LOC129987579 [Argiope bruennichi]|uniref:uncharacterized protein LOC129987579 n=1 Tax=Argiope bruennichi TaxID=94029 RepID=UPI0024942F59|nr:uncharacterized protein LOC129987579 [Argiope bruennichi]
MKYEYEAATKHVARSICSYSSRCVSNPVQLWNLHRENMSEDILHKTRITVNNMDLDYNDEIFNRALLALEDKIKALGVFTETGGLFFLDAPGGTGNTYLINLLLARIRQRNLIALAVASSGIAATLLTGGRTAHSVFKLPINLSFAETPVCNISRSSDRSKLLKKCKLIVSDECTMAHKLALEALAHKLALEALNTTMQDNFQNNECMGGITLFFSGDFRQTLPVIPQGTNADEMNASIKASYIRKNFQRFGLKTNMRVLLTGDISTEQFSQNLLHLGNGTMTIDSEGLIALPYIGNIVATMKDLQYRVFPNIENEESLTPVLIGLETTLNSRPLVYEEGKDDSEQLHNLSFSPVKKLTAANNHSIYPG